MRVAFVFVLGLLAAFTPMLTVQPVQAQSRCSWGCNVLDDGQFNSNLIGRTVYVNGKPRRVTSIDTYNRKVRYVTPSGEYYSESAQRVYTKKRLDERNMAYAGGAAALACLFFCPRGEQQSSRRPSQQQSNSQALNSCLNQCYRQGDPDPNRESALQAGCRRSCYSTYR